MSSNALEELLATPGGKAMIGKLEAEAQAANDEDRRRLADKLAEINETAERQAAEILPKIAKAEARATAAKAELDAANRGLAALRRIRSNASDSAASDREGIRRELEATHPREIDVLIDQIDKALDGMNRQASVSEIRELDKDHRLGGKVRAFFSNQPSIARRVDRLLEARQQAYSLRSRFVDDLPAELRSIREALRPDDLQPVAISELPD